MRSCTAAVSSLGVVVMIVKDSSGAPVGSFQRSHSPAKANGSPLARVKA